MFHIKMYESYLVVSVPANPSIFIDFMFKSFSYAANIIVNYLLVIY